VDRFFIAPAERRLLRGIVSQAAERHPVATVGAKGGQSKLEADLQTLFDLPVVANFVECRQSRWESSERGHGRTEEQACHAL
jgi:hypothetical protein